MISRALSSGFLVVALALAAGCSGSAVEQPAATSTAAMTTAPLAVTVHGPAAKAVTSALATIPLRADQRTAIEQLATDTETKNAPVRQAREQLVLALADQIQAGTIDRAALQPKIDAITSEWQKAQPVDRAAFERLHELLTPDQRAALANALQGDMNAPHHEHMMRMQKWVADLGLTQDQQDQIRAKLADKWREHAVEHATAATSGADTATMAGGAVEGMMHGRVMRERTQKMLEAFKGDKFSMDAAMPIPAGMQGHAREFSGRMLEMVETVLPILTPEQRALAASKLRERAAHFEE